MWLYNHEPLPLVKLLVSFSVTFFSIVVVTWLPRVMSVPIQLFFATQGLGSRCAISVVLLVDTVLNFLADCLLGLNEENNHQVVKLILEKSWLFGPYFDPIADEVLPLLCLCCGLQGFGTNS
jgi:hypothetical protein